MYCRLSWTVNCQEIEYFRPLAIKSGGLGFRSSSSLTPSTFLASTVGTEELHALILAWQGKITNHSARFHTKQGARKTEGHLVFITTTWWSLRKAKVLDRKIIEQFFCILLANCISQIDKAHILASKAAHTGDWLNAPPITSIHLPMCNETIWIDVGLRLGAKLYESHQCMCVTLVDARDLHGLRCRCSACRQVRQSLLNDTIWHAVNKAGVQSTKEPFSLLDRKSVV